MPSQADFYTCPDGKGGSVLQNMPCDGSPQEPSPSATEPPAPSPPPPQRLSLEQAPHLAEGLRALRKLRSATEVGMTRGDYARQLVEAKAVINEAVRASTDTTGKELQTALVAILQIYLDALTAWRMFDEGISSPPKEFERFKRAYHAFGVNFTKEGTLGVIWLVGKYRLEQLGQLVQ